MDLQAHWENLAYDREAFRNCEDEPLQFCGAIQGHGQLVVWDRPSGRIVAVSENISEIALAPGRDLLGCLVSELLPGVESVTELETRHPHELRLPGQVPRGVAYHFLGDYGYAEIEPPAGVNGSVESSLADLRRMIHNMESLAHEVEVCQLAADQLREISHFERVMVYRFEQNWDGQVVAESVVESLEPFQGLFYPASDIPEQARKLYLNTRYRLISDALEAPLPILTRVGLGRSELDLSHCSLRACSPMHIGYLINMGVRASFSVPIKLDGRLWGLISCHHSSQPKLLSHNLRVASEMIAQVVSARVAALRNQRRLEIRNSILELSQRLLAEVTRGKTAVSAFQALSQRVLQLTNSQGAFVRLAGQEAFLGDCPDPAFVDQLWNHLRGQGAMSLWSSDSLVEAGLPKEVKAAGAMAVPFSLGFEDLLIWFRPEHVREVSWGGKPQPKGDGFLQPRQSFSAWTETVHQRSRLWSEADDEAAQYLLFNFVQGIFENAADLARANQELERLTRAKDEFIGMISHELRTPLGVILGWVEILRDMEQEYPPLVEPLEVIERNAKTQVSLINDLLDISRIVSGKMRINPQAGVDICALIHDVVNSLQPTAQARRISLTATCESLILSADPERLRQIIWNLASNALKFTPKEGRVEVTAQRFESACRLEVKDSGIGFEPKVSEKLFTRFVQVDDSGHRAGGLGLGLSIVRSLVELHGGTVEALSAGPGLGSTFTVTLPLYSLRSVAEEPAAAPASVSLFLKGWKILVAEDQPDAASALAYLLRRQGAEVELAANGTEALELLKRQTFDLLLSDIGMPEADGYQLIRRWRLLEKERQQEPMPALALTAYAASADRVRALEAGYQNHIAKPVERNELFAVIRTLRKVD